MEYDIKDIALAEGVTGFSGPTDACRCWPDPGAFPKEEAAGRLMIAAACT